jgi:predicted ATPase
MAGGAILRGWALAMQGRAEEGIAHMRQGLTAYRATGAKYCRPFWLAMLAEAYSQAGRADEGLRALDEALAHVDKTGECLGFDTADLQDARSLLEELEG